MHPRSTLSVYLEANVPVARAGQTAVADFGLCCSVKHEAHGLCSARSDALHCIALRALSTIAGGRGGVESVCRPHAPFRLVAKQHNAIQQISELGAAFFFEACLLPDDFECPGRFSGCLPRDGEPLSMLGVAWAIGAE